MKNFLKTINKNWLIVWIIIYIGFLSLGLFLPNFFGASLLQYLGIVLCLVYAYQNFKKDVLLLIALSFTLLADTVLLINNTSTLGVLVFCFAQFFHAIRLKKASPLFLIHYSACSVAILLISISFKLEPIYPIAALYAGTLAANVIMSIKWHTKSRTAASRCAMYGFILFACCDLCVAASFLSHSGALPNFIYPFANYFAWLFYYPSQVFISNSAIIPVKNQKKSPQTKKTMLK